MEHTYFVVLAGGRGERLWPLSRAEHPKQLIPFLNNKSLLEQTLERIKPLAINPDHVVVVTNHEQYEAVKAVAAKHASLIIAEPASRNTGPAILLACYQIAALDKDAVIIILPSDAFIPDQQAFCETITPTLEYLYSNDKIATFGLKPTYAATGYGYIQADILQSVADNRGYLVTRFHEKPNLVKAEEYLQQTCMFWNIGIFAGKVSTVLQEFSTCSPDLFEAITNYMDGKIEYKDVPSISIDYAVMEKSLNVVVFPANFEWYDVGNLNVFLTLKAKYESHQQPMITIDGSGNLASTHKKIVACIGVSDLCIVETDDVILIAQKNQSENVKKVLEHVKTSHQACL